MHEHERFLNGSSSLASLLHDCIEKKDLSLGEHTYSLYIRDGLQGNTYLGCLLIRMFTSCGNLHKACHVFLNMHDHDVYTWTAIILAHVQLCQSEKAIVYYEQMQWSFVEANPCTFVAVLKACDHLCNLEQGMVIHMNVAGQQYDGNLIVQSALIGMYTNCGCLHDARNLFDGLPKRDHASWSVMIRGYVLHNQRQEAFELVEQMQQQGIKPNKATFLVLLKALTSITSMVEKENFYSNIVKLGLEDDVHIGSSLLNMYAKCDRFEEAFKIFDSLLQERDIVSWNVMIAGMTKHGYNVDILQLLEKMRFEKVSPSGATYVSLLQCVTNVDEGRYIHADILKLGLELHLQVGSSLVSMYVKDHCVIDARNVFDSLLTDNVVLWSSMMTGYVEHGLAEQVFVLYMNMLLKGTKPDGYTFSCLLQATYTLCLGYLVHIHIVEATLESNLFIGNVMIDMYARCGSLECAQAVFDRLPTRNSVSFSTMISWYLDYNYGGKAFQLFLESWLEIIEPDRVMILCILSYCSNISASSDGTLIYGSIVELGLQGDVSIGSALVDLFARSGNFEDANKVFYMLSTCNVVAYSALISAYAEHGHFETALQLSKRMQEEGLKPDVITWICILQACSGLGSISQGKQIHADVVKQGCERNVHLGGALVNMYANCGKLEDSRKIFDGLHPRDVALWSALISGHVENGSNEEAMRLFEKMQQEGAMPNAVTFLCIFEACSTLANLHCGISLHSEVRKQGLELDPTVGIALIDMYCKCGSLKQASKVFKELKDKSLVSWYTMIAGCADHGSFTLADQYLENMQDTGMLPDAGIFVGILSACSHAGLVEEGLQFFNALIKYKFVTPMVAHYICLVDILGRAGCVHEAKEIAFNMPYQPSSVVWVALLGSCVKHGSVDKARQTFKFLSESNNRDVVAGYVLMHNIYAATI